MGFFTLSLSASGGYSPGPSFGAWGSGGGGGVECRLAQDLPMWLRLALNSPFPCFCLLRAGIKSMQH